MDAFIISTKKYECKILNFLKNYYKYIIGGFGIGVLTYFMMMSLNLVNDLDGIWHPSNFIAGDWEISLGRGLQRYADRARFGIVSDAFNTMISLLLISFSNVLILKKFNLENTFFSILFMIVLIANPIICNILSYSYMSINFALAYLFSVLSFLCVNNLKCNIKKRMALLVLGSLFLAISMAFYQAYICLLCVLFSLYILKMILDKVEVQNLFQYIGLCGFLICLGGFIYYLISHALLYRAGVHLASYRGASNVSLSSIFMHFPHSLQQSYLQFYNYFFIKKTLSDLEFVNIVIIGLFVIYSLAFWVQIIKIFKENKIKSFLFAMIVGLLPVSSCVILIISVGNIMTNLMSVGLIMSLVLLGIIVPQDGKIGFFLKRIYLFFLISFVWFQLSATINDQLAFKEGKTATITLSENIFSRLCENGYIDGKKSIAFVGRPGNNDIFVQSEAYKMANEYSKFGCWSVDARNNKVSWAGVMSNFLGVNINLCSETDYKKIVMLERVSSMPEFPAENSICIIDDIVVVKVSDIY